MELGNHNLIDDDQDDIALRRLLAPQQQQIAPPPELVTRMLRELPSGTPQVVAERLAQHRQRRVARILALLVPIALLAAYNIWGVAGRGPQVAFLFGDGRAGLSSVLLSAQLVAKPFWNMLGTIHPAWLVLGALVAVASVIALVRLARRAREQFETELQ